MKRSYQYLNFLLLSALIMLGTACSDSGGGSKNAEITNKNLEEIATAGTEGTKQAVNSNSAPLIFGARVATSSSVENLTVSIVKSALQNPKFVFVDVSAEICTGGGTATGDGDENSATIEFTNCSSGGVVLNGTVKLKSSTSGSTTTFTFEYINFTIVVDGRTETIDLKATCTSTSTGFSCTYDSEALGIDGRTYEVSDINISGNASSGFNVNCVVNDPDNGRITISTATPITFNCPNGQPDNGSIVIEDGDGNIATLTFIDCNNYSVDFNGSTTTFTWP